MKTSNLIKELIKDGENVQIELRDESKPDSIAKTICSFLNTKGGKIIIGIKMKTIVGILKAPEKLELIEESLRKISPPSLISIREEKIEDKSILLIETLEGSRKPYVFEGNIYLRDDTTTRLAEPEDIAVLIENRIKADLHWERFPVLGLDISDLDSTLIKETITEINKRGRDKINLENPLDFLNKYGLYLNSQFSNAALLLFGKEPSKYIPQCRVRLVVYESDKISDSFKYDRYYEGNLFKILNDLIHFFETTISIVSTFSEIDWKRSDKPQYPLQALREGILNALIHRDYSNHSGSFIIGIYTDRIEISSFGELPDAITISTLKKDHISIPRNPDLAHMFFLTGWIDKVGRGTQKILDECRQFHMKSPRWSSGSGCTILTFWGSVNQKINISSDALNERQKRILKIIAPNEKITLKDYMLKTGAEITDRSARNDLSILVNGGWFRKQGKGSSTVYIKLVKKKN